MTRSIRLVIRSLIALVLTAGILASTFVAPQSVQAAASGSWENLGIFNWGGNGIWGAAANDIWTVGNSGTIMHFDGVYWHTILSPTTNTLNGIWGTAWDNIYAVGDGVIIHYDGTSWSAVSLPGGPYGSRYVSISGTGPNNIWVVGSCGTNDLLNHTGVIVHYDGTNWSRDYPDYNGWFGFTAVSCVTETFVAAIGQIKDLAIWRWTGTEWVPTKTPYIEFQEGWYVSDIYGNYAAAGRGKVLKWNGTEWIQITDGKYWVGGGIWASSDNDVFVSGSEGPMWHWDGSSWQQQQVTTGYWFNDFWGTGPSNVFAVGAGCVRYDGSRWREFGIKAWLLDIYGTSLNNIWVCGEAEYVGYFDGTGWYVSHPVPFPWGSKHHLHGIWTSGPNDVFAVGHATYQDEPRKILHYDGTSWSEMGHPAGPLYGVWGTSPTNVFAVGDYWGFMGATYNNIIRYGGSNWTPMISNAQNQFRDVWGSGPNDVWAVGANGLIAHYNGTGNSWSITPSPTGYWFEGIWGSGPNDIFIVGEAGVIYHFDGSAWSPMTSPTSTRLVGIWGNSPSNVFATGENGVILHYDGNTWSTMSQTYTTGSIVDVWGASGSQPVFYAAGDNGCVLRNNTSSGDPPAVTTGVYTNLQQTTVTLNGNLTDKGTAGTVNVRFQYGTTPGGSYPGSTADQPKTNTGTFSANVMNLTPNTTYYYRAVAVGDGTVYGNEGNFKTLQLTNIPTIATNPATVITTTSATLNITYDFKDANSGSVQFAYRPSGGSWTYTSWVAKTGSGSYAETVSGLPTNTAYEFKARLKYYATEIEGSVLTFVLITPPNPPPSISAYEGNGQIKLIWTKAADRTVIVRKTGGYPTNRSDGTQIYFGTDYQYIDTGLNNGTTYYYSFWGEITVGSTQLFSNNYTQISETPMGPVTAPTVATNDATNVSSNGAQLNGYLGSLGTASSVNINFIYGNTQGGPYPLSTPLQNVSSLGNFSANLTGLPSGTTYYFRAVAVGNGTSQGEEKSFTSKVPPVLTTTAATGITTSSATLNVSYDFKDYSGSVQFAYKKTADAGWTYTEWRAVPNSGSYSEPLSGLTSNTEYQFKARLKYGTTEMEGSPLTFTTAKIVPSLDPVYSANPVTPFTATLNGGYKFNDYLSGYVQFAYKKTIESTWTLTAWQARSGSGNYYEVITGLISHTEYQYKTRLKYDSIEIEGPVSTFVTPVAIASISTGAASAVTATTATLNLSYDFMNAGPGSVRFGYKKTGDSTATFTSWQAKSGSGIYAESISGLTPGTQYQFRAQLLKYDNTWIQGQEQTFTSTIPVVLPKLVFTSDRDGNEEIYSMYINGVVQTQLTNNPARDTGPALSPDKTKIAFTSWRDGNADIYVMNADGTGVVRLTANAYWDCWPAWSPDGSKIAFVSNRDGYMAIYVMNSDGSGQTRLTDNPTGDVLPTWSPDGTKIAFTSYRNGDVEIYVMNADGGGVTRLTNNSATDHWPAWSPDGTKIAFMSTRGINNNAEIYLMDPDGKNQVNITNNPATDTQPSWITLPSGLLKIAFTTYRNGNPEVYTVLTSGSGLWRLTNNTSGEWTRGGYSAPGNDPPQIGSIELPTAPIIIGSTVNGTATFTDPDTTDTHGGTWDWGDGQTSAAVISETGGSGTATGSHTYTEAGVYEVKVTIYDLAGAWDEAVFRYVVVYDPNGGFVTGGGWINSPAGAYSANQTLTGKATFGFVAKYKKGANVPTGQTEFQFHVANLNFHSESYDWLVVASTKAQYKGTGTITGLGGTYRFMLTAIDGDLLAGGKGPDKFRIRIWGDNSLIYDNQMGKDENGDFATEIQGGSIVIHK